MSARDIEMSKIRLVVPEEPWHLRYTAGDNVPAAVQAWLDRKKVV